jgi:hypothetical protein
LAFEEFRYRNVQSIYYYTPSPSYPPTAQLARPLERGVASFEQAAALQCFSAISNPLHVFETEIRRPVIRVHPARIEAAMSSRHWENGAVFRFRDITRSTLPLTLATSSRACSRNTGLPNPFKGRKKKKEQCTTHARQVLEDGCISHRQVHTDSPYAR